jgi:hypothetical protein
MGLVLRDKNTYQKQVIHLQQTHGRIQSHQPYDRDIVICEFYQLILIN